MRIVNLRLGFQADHSSSSYLFYAADRPVGTEGQRLAHRFSSRADVDARRARYQKWGESELRSEAFGALLGAHYDVMVSESYDWWTFRIAVPKNARTRALLGPFADARGVDDLGVDLEEYGQRLGVVVHCRIDGGAPVFDALHDDDPFENIVELLVAVRRELLGGDVTFLRAVADYYEADLDGDDDRDDEDDEGEGDESDGDEGAVNDLAALGRRTKADLRRECERRGVATKASWTKAELLAALAKRATAGRGAPARGATSGKGGSAEGAAAGKGATPGRGARAGASAKGAVPGRASGRAPRLSAAARTLLASMAAP